MAPRAFILHISKSSSNELQNKFHVNPVAILAKQTKSWLLSYFGPIWVEKDPNV